MVYNWQKAYSAQNSLQNYYKWDTTTTNTFVSNKDKTPKEFQSSVVYKFSRPGCSQSYIGKTDRCIYTRLKEHTTSKDLEIFKHTNTCEQFNSPTY